MLKKSGFTLVELLVVISIIAILSLIGLTVYTNVQKGARDAKRKADIDAIANAMEANYASGQYVALIDSMFSSNAIPQDPIDTTSATVTDNTCPNVCRYCVKQGTSLQSGAACVPSTVGWPSGTSSNRYWVVCANLEGGSSYCRSNTQ